MSDRERLARLSPERLREIRRMVGAPGEGDGWYVRAARDLLRELDCHVSCAPRTPEGVTLEPRPVVPEGPWMIEAEGDDLWTVRNGHRAFTARTKMEAIACRDALNRVTAGDRGASRQESPNDSSPVGAARVAGGAHPHAEIVLTGERHPEEHQPCPRCGGFGGTHTVRDCGGAHPEPTVPLAALELYGEHTVDCDIMMGYKSTCTCGFDATLERGRAVREGEA